MSTKGDRRTPVSEHPLLADELQAAVTDHRVAVESPATVASRRREGGLGIAPQRLVALGLAIAGVVALVVGWIGVSTKVEVWEQMPYLMSGGFGGAILVGLGIAVYVSHEHAEDRRQRDLLARRVEQLEAQLTTQLTWRLDELEMALAAELDGLAARLDRATDRR